MGSFFAILRAQRSNRHGPNARMQVDAVGKRAREARGVTLDVRFYPKIIQFLGMNPLPVPTTRGEAIMRERLSRGWSRKYLAKIAGVDEATVRRLEVDRPRLAQRPTTAVVLALGLGRSPGSRDLHSESIKLLSTARAMTRL